MNQRIINKSTYGTFFSTFFTILLFYYYSGDNMNYKFIGVLIIAIVLGFISSKIVYGLTDKKNDEEYNAYFLQAFVYTDNKNIDEILKKFDSYVIEDENGKKHVYVGITSSKNNKDKIEKLYKSKNVEIYAKKRMINNNNFMINLKQYDIFLSELNKEEDIFSVTEAILSNYDEFVLGN